MTDPTETPERVPNLPTLRAGGAVRPIVAETLEDAWRIATAVCRAGMAPRGLETPDKAVVAILAGAEVGLAPMQALQSIAVIGGRPSLLATARSPWCATPAGSRASTSATIPRPRPPAARSSAKASGCSPARSPRPTPYRPAYGAKRPAGVSRPPG